MPLTPRALIPRELVVGAVQMFSVKTSDGVVATSFKKDDKVPQSLNPNLALLSGAVSG